MSAPARLRLASLAARAAAAAPVRLAGERQVVLFLSFTDGSRRARVLRGTGVDGSAAWNDAAARLPDDIGALRYLRLDIVTAVNATDWATVRAQLGRTKRNYYRLGVALDPAFRHAFLETELNANAMLDGGRDLPTAAVNPANFHAYAEARDGVAAIAFDDDAPVWTFVTTGWFVGEDGIVHPLESDSRDRGRRQLALDPPAIERLVASGSRYLAAQVDAAGRFHYGWHPCFDRPIPTYNALRHASTTYAMLEAWEVTRDPQLRAAIDRALDHLRTRLLREVMLPDGRSGAMLVEADGEIKLGGNAVAVLALAKHAELTGSTADDALLGRIGEGLLHMQDAATGAFAHVLDADTLAVKQVFRIIYYDGEAAFALLRLHERTADPRWLAAAARAFDHFLAAGHARAHDHWLAYAAELLTRVRPEARYYRFGLDNVRDHLGFVRNRITTFPTLLELMTATERLVARLRADPALTPLLRDFDLPDFYGAMHARAHYLLNGHFWPELAMFFARPDKIVGSFFIRHHGFRIRIDDVEHYLSGLIAYRRYLLSNAASNEPQPAVPEALAG